MHSSWLKEKTNSLWEYWEYKETLGENHRFTILLAVLVLWVYAYANIDQIVHFNMYFIVCQLYLNTIFLKDIENFCTLILEV